MEYIKHFLDSTSYEEYIQSETSKFPNVSLTEDDNVVHYNSRKPVPPPHDYSQDYLTLEILEDGYPLSLDIYDSIYISIDGGKTWTQESVEVNTGDRILIKGDVKEFISSQYWLGYGGRCNVEGNVMSIYDSTGFRTRTSFSNNNHNLIELFIGKNIVSAENLILPATALTDWCYTDMFKNCELLITAPILPATALTEGCYSGMFEGCRSLTTAPELPATTLRGWCYKNMFYQCSSLNSIKCLATDISATDCTDVWVSGVSSSGTFIKASSADWSGKTSSSGIPNNWEIQNAN